VDDAKTMGLLDWFRRPPPIVDRASLADFLDTRAAFLAQKSIWDYARGRSGPYFSMIVKEQAFLEGVEVARWKNYPFGLSIVAEMIHGVLLPFAGPPAPLAASLCAVALDVFDRYPVPAALGEAEWKNARAELATRCQQIGLHPPKAVKDIPVPFAQVFFDNMPIHERLRENDFELIRNQLLINLVSMHRDFTRYANLSAVAAALAAADYQAA
jgi:hypothetical protein